MGAIHRIFWTSRCPPSGEIKIHVDLGLMNRIPGFRGSFLGAIECRFVTSRAIFSFDFFASVILLPFVPCSFLVHSVDVLSFCTLFVKVHRSFDYG